MQCGSPHFVWWTKTKAISNFSKITEDLIKVLFKKKVYKKMSLEIKLGHTILEHKRKLGNKKKLTKQSKWHTFAKHEQTTRKVL